MTSTILRSFRFDTGHAGKSILFEILSLISLCAKVSRKANVFYLDVKLTIKHEQYRMFRVFTRAFKSGVLVHAENLFDVFVC